MLIYTNLKKILFDLLPKMKLKNTIKASLVTDAGTKELKWHSYIMMPPPPPPFYSCVFLPRDMKSNLKSSLRISVFMSPKSIFEGSRQDDVAVRSAILLHPWNIQHTHTVSTWPWTAVAIVCWILISSKSFPVRPQDLPTSLPNSALMGSFHSPLFAGQVISLFCFNNPSF